METDAKNLFENLNSKKKENTKIYFDFFEALDHGDTLHLVVYAAFDALFKSKNE